MARLKTLEFDIPTIGLPRKVLDLLNDADARIDAFHHAHRNEPVAAFVPSDFVLVYQALSAIAERGLAPGRRFLEWGCGVGVATCLAAYLGFDAVGIEIEEELVDESISLAREHGIEAEFVSGSFVPPEHEDLFDMLGDFNWVRTDGGDAYQDLDLDPDDFDVVYCYPWPGEEALSEELFAECGASGALFLSFHGNEGMRLRRRR